MTTGLKKVLIKITYFCIVFSKWTKKGFIFKKLLRIQWSITFLTIRIIYTHVSVRYFCCQIKFYIYIWILKCCCLSIGSYLWVCSRLVFKLYKAWVAQNQVFSLYIYSLCVVTCPICAFDSWLCCVIVIVCHYCLSQ